jgi:hypothetical protein
MRWLNAAAVMALVGAGLTGAEKTKARVVRFTKDDVGKLPAGWKAEQTHQGANSSIWKVVADDTAPSGKGYVLAQTAQSPNRVFNLCVVEDSTYKNPTLSVSFKAMRGKNDQGGGFVWRYLDANNYYIARMNPLESNYRVYKVVAGVRKELKRKENLSVRAGEWHKLKVRQKGNHIECFLDGKKMLDARDDTFKKAGKVGLWSKSDAQTHFDGFRVSGK